MNSIRRKKSLIPKVFVDMDGVIVDFEGYMAEHGLAAEEIKEGTGHYLAMKPIYGALEAIRELLSMGVDVFIATKPPTDNASAYMEKALWIFEYLPELKKKITVTSHKGMLGDELDFLVDDRPHKAFCEEFEGLLIKFETNNEKEWDRVLSIIKQALSER